MSVDEDPVGHVRGLERSDRRVCGITKVSKTKLKHLAITQPIDDLASQKYEIQDIKCTLNTMAGLMQTLIKYNDSNIASTSVTTSASRFQQPLQLCLPVHHLIWTDNVVCRIILKYHFPLLQLTTPSLNQVRAIFVNGFSHGNPIALGEANPKPTL